MRKAGRDSVIRLPCPLALLDFVSSLRLSCGVPVFPVLVISEEPFLVNEVVLLTATQDVRSVVDLLEFCSDALVPATAVNAEDGIDFAHVRIDEDIIGESLVKCEEYLLAIYIHAVENIDIVVDKLDHNSDECSSRLIDEFATAFHRLLVFLIRFVCISHEHSELLLRCGIIPIGIRILPHCLRVCLLVCLIRLILMLFKRGEFGELLLTLLDEFVIAFAIGLEIDFRHRIRLSHSVCSYNLI